MQGVQVWFPVKKLRFHMLHDSVKTKKKAYLVPTHLLTQPKLVLTNSRYAYHSFYEWEKWMVPDHRVS